MKWLKNSLTSDQIKQYLPHRGSFLMVDKVTSIEIPEGEDLTGATVEALKCLTATDPVFFGHFPDQAIFPGVMHLEAMAQAASFIMIPNLIDSEDDLDKLPQLKVFLMSAEHVKFRKPVGPGDLLFLNAELLKSKGNIWQFQCHVKCEEKVVSEARVMAMVETINNTKED